MTHFQKNGERIPIIEIGFRFSGVHRLNISRIWFPFKCFIFYHAWWPNSKHAHLNYPIFPNALDVERQLNVYKMFRTCLGYLLNVANTFKLHHLSKGFRVAQRMLWTLLRGPHNMCLVIAKHETFITVFESFQNGKKKMDPDQKQSSAGVLLKRSLEKRGKFYKKALAMTSYFSKNCRPGSAILLKIVVRSGCFPANFVTFFKTTFFQSTWKKTH